MNDSSFFKEWVKPIARNIFSGLLFVLWWGWTQKDEADKTAKANLFGKHDAQVTKDLSETREEKLIMEAEYRALVLRYIDEKACGCNK